MRRLALVPLVVLAAACSSVEATQPQAVDNGVPGEFACPDPASGATPGGTTVSGGAVAVRLCPHLEVLRYDRPPEPNMVAPVDALTAGVDELVAAINAQPLVDTDGVQMCPAGGGMNFLLVLQYADGALRTVEGSLGGCAQVYLGRDVVREGARPILETYDELLLAQRGATSPPGVTLELTCPTDLDSGYELVTPTARPTEVTRAIVCSRERWKQPFGPPVPLDDEEVDRLAHDVSGTGASPDDPPEGLRNCGEPLRTMIVAQTVWGDVFQLEDICTYLLYSNFRNARVWEQSEQTSATLDSAAAPTLRP